MMLRIYGARVNPRQYLFQRDPVCCYCRKRFKRMKGSTLDHVIPQCKGGLTNSVNIRLACKRCNQRKADLDGWQLLVWSLRVLLTELRVRSNGGATCTE